ncbi:MAG: Macrolide export ATP-binding/permease protein MacB [Verrucomicrobiota bacterium]|jgi:putative ABC transport system permease protein
MARLLQELVESFRIAFAQIRANALRSVLTALGVIIGIVAVTLMGTAINGIDIGFNRSLAMLGEDVLYVQRWPWRRVEDWWNYVNRPPLEVETAERLNRVIEATPGSLLEVAVPVATRGTSVRAGELRLGGVMLFGTTGDYARIVTTDVAEGRMFNDVEASVGRPVCVLGSAVAENLFPGRSALDQSVQIRGERYTVIGVLAKQGEFLGLFSFDNQIVAPLNTVRRQTGVRANLDLRVKVRDKTKLAAAEEELIGAMRRVRGQLPGERDNFSVNQQQAFKEQLDPVKAGIALAGLFITGLSLFVGAIGIMNITFVSVKERTKEIGTRKALGARRRTILLQFLIEAVSICLIGGLVGLGVTLAASLVLATLLPALPIAFSPSLMAVSVLVSILTGVVSGFAPAWGASRLDPVVALRYE